MLQYRFSQHYLYYQRLVPSIYCKLIDTRSSGSALARCPVVDMSLYGMRIHTNQTLDVQKSLRWELLFPDNSTIKCKACVVWVKRLPNWASATYDVGLRFLELSDENLQRLVKFLQLSPTLVNLWESHDNRQ